MSTNEAAAIFGPYTALTSGMKIKAEPKPEKPRTRPESSAIAKVAKNRGSARMAAKCELSGKKVTGGIGWVFTSNCR